MSLCSKQLSKSTAHSMARKEARLTADAVRDMLRYDPQSGNFWWCKGRRVGQIAGTISKYGYVRITITHKSLMRRYMAHRLAWLYTHGEWPKKQIDHRDGVRSNNSLANLREASRAQNAANAKVRNKNGFKGVAFHKARTSRRKFAAVIKIGTKQKTLGYFVTAKEAHDCYVASARVVHGEFARAK